MRLHRDHQQRRLAAQPVRRAEPADPDQGRPDTPQRGLDPGLTRPAQTRPAARRPQPRPPARPACLTMRAWPSQTRAPKLLMAWLVASQENRIVVMTDPSCLDAVPGR